MNTNALVPVFAGSIASQSTLLCNARDLHGMLQVRRDFSNWIKGRINKYAFEEDSDFIVISRSPILANGNRGASIDYHLTLNMGKELAMVENNEKGREVRRYFIECEKNTQQAKLSAPSTIEKSPQEGQLYQAVCEKIKGLTVRHSFGQYAPQVLTTLNKAVQLPRQRGFFASFVYGRECDGYNTREGKKSAGLCYGC